MCEVNDILVTSQQPHILNRAIKLMTMVKGAYDSHKPEADIDCSWSLSLFYRKYNDHCWIASSTHIIYEGVRWPIAALFWNNRHPTMSIGLRTRLERTCGNPRCVNPNHINVIKTSGNEMSSQSKKRKTGIKIILSNEIYEDLIEDLMSIITLDDLKKVAQTYRMSLVYLKHILNGREHSSRFVQLSIIKRKTLTSIYDSLRKYKRARRFTDDDLIQVVNEICQRTPTKKIVEKLGVCSSLINSILKDDDYIMGRIRLALGDVNYIKFRFIFSLMYSGTNVSHMLVS